MIRAHLEGLVVTTMTGGLLRLGDGLREEAGDHHRDQCGHQHGKQSVVTVLVT
jgi:hypothetical protein